MRYSIFIFVLIVWNLGALYTNSMSQFKVATVQEPSGCVWLMSTILDSAALDGQDSGTNLRDPSAKEYVAHKRWQNE